MRTYALENRGRAPLYEYLYRCIRGDILDGTLTAGERLPSKRALAEHLHISVMTVEGAYQQLEAEGYVYTQPKRGFFVAEVERPRPAAPAPPAPEAPPEAPVWRLDLKSNQVDASRFPAAAWARLTRQVLSEDGEALLRPVPHQGLPALRQAIARDLREYKGMAVPPEQIVVGAGAEYLYLLLAQLLGREAVFAVEDPGYPKIRQVYGKCGAACRPVPLDGQGVPPEALEAAGASVVHLSPAHHYPTGLVTPIGRRQALLRWAEKAGGIIIEDDYDSEFRFTGRPIPTLQSIDTAGRVVYMNTFSQTISPSMRVDSWCCRPACWSSTAGSWIFIPARCPPWTSTCWPGSWTRATTSSTWPGCARSTAPVTTRFWPPSGPALSGIGSRSRSRGRGSTFSCGWTPGRATGPCGTGLRPWASGWAFSRSTPPSPPLPTPTRWW